MVLSTSDKAVIEACFLEKGWRGKKICTEFKSIKWDVTTVNRLIGKIVSTGTTTRKAGSGRPVTARTLENIAVVKELALSQEDSPGSHTSQWGITRLTGISRRSVQRIIKGDLNLKSVKKINTPQIEEGSRQRRILRSQSLLESFNQDDVTLMCFEDEKDFTIQLPRNRQNDRLYTAGLKRDVNPDRLFHKSNKFSEKLMVSCVVSYNGISNPFFVNPQAIKVNSELYTNHLRDDLLPACHDLYPGGDFIFVQDGAPSHTANKCQEFLRQELGNQFVDKLNWPPKSPDCNPLDYFFLE